MSLLPSFTHSAVDQSPASSASSLIASSARKLPWLAVLSALAVLAGVTRLSYEMGKQAVDGHLPIVSPAHAHPTGQQQSQTLMQLLLPGASDEQLSMLCSDHFTVNVTATQQQQPLQRHNTECTTMPCPRCPQCVTPAPTKPALPPLDHLWFSHAYIVGYRPEKWQHFLEQFEEEGWSEFREMVVRDKVPIVDGTKLDRKQLVADGMLLSEEVEVQYGDYRKSLHLGTIASSYAHLYAWQACYNETHKVKDHTNTVKHCFVGEDDGDFTKHNLTIHDMRQWGDWLQQAGLMQMYDVLYVGYGYSWYWDPAGSTTHFGVPSWQESRLFWYPIHAYVISAGAAQKLAASLLPLQYPADVYVGKLCSEGVLRCLQVVPEELVPQGPNSRGSDTDGIN